MSDDENLITPIWVTEAWVPSCNSTIMILFNELYAEKMTTM